ncbi:hypothetical protein Plhal304r1_c076g0163201 [Plasmopara halstedii]
MEPTTTNYRMRFLRPSPLNKTSSTRSKLFVLCVTLAVSALLVFLFFYPILRGYSGRSVYLLQFCLAIGLLEKSWWNYRIRQRFLVLFEASVAVLFVEAEFDNLQHDPSEYDLDIHGRIEPSAYAVTTFTKRYIKSVRCAVVVLTLLTSSTIAAAGITIVLYSEDVVVVCAAVGCFAGVLCACFAPTPGDGVAIMVHEGALTVTAMNTMIVQYTGSKMQMAILDYLFVALAGWVVIVISRIVVSKKQLECFLMVALDTVALAHVTIVMMEIVEIVDHPRANTFSREFSAYFVTIACAELGHYLFDAVTTEWLPTNFHRWRLKSQRLYEATDLVVSVIFGAAGMLIWMKGVFNMNLSPLDSAALLGATALSQLGRSLITLTYDAAMALPWYRAKFTIWNNGIMELMNPFLVGWIVFHPYAKSILVD